MHYEDFVLHIGAPVDPETYPLQVLSSPGGEARGLLRLPPELFNARLDHSLGVSGQPMAAAGEGSSLPLRDLQPPLPAELRVIEPQSLGEKLFRALFAEEVGRLYDYSRGRIENAYEEERQGLRIRLHLEPGHPDLAKLCTLPWELLYDPNAQVFLGLSPSHSVVRYIDLPRPATPGQLQLPLRILVVLSRPSGLPGLDFDRERREIEEAWSVQGEVDVQILPEATLKSLQDTWRRNRFHVLHFVGHGAFHGPDGQGLLFFEDPSGQRPVPGQQLAALLQLPHPPILVFLNACQSARLGDTPGLNPGLSTALLQAGIPAIMGMQLPISDRAAIAFSRSFYRSLARGYSFDESVNQGRQAIYLDTHGSIEWATPVALLRTPHSRLFDLPSRLFVGTDEEIQEPKPLQDFQRDIYVLFDDLGISAEEDYLRMNLEEKMIVSREIVRRMTGLGADPADLLDLMHVNMRFPSKDLLASPEILKSLDTLHRKTALYSDHTVVCLPPLTLPRSFGPGSREEVLRDESIPLLIQHRPLIQAGKMSVVPESLIREDDQACLFNVRQLDTTKVDFSDISVRSMFLRAGKAMRRTGALVFESREGGSLRLEDILEIEDRFKAEYSYFQTHMRSTLLSINPQDETTALKRALVEVESGIQQLNGLYEDYQRRSRLPVQAAPGSGTLTVALYADDPNVAQFIMAAFTGGQVGSVVRFVEDVKTLPDTIRRSPYFVPWLIQQGGSVSELGLE